MESIVSVEWLNKNLEDKHLILLDASTSSVLASNEESTISIKNARFFDLKNHFSAKNSTLPNTIPTSTNFEIEARKLGINNHSKIVIFDNLGIYSSPRAWWLFKIMGHSKVAVLDGGLPAWLKQKAPTEELNKKLKINLGDFTSSYNSQLFRDYHNILNNLKSNKEQVIDARSADRFNAITPEPRPRLRGGNIPNSVNIPFELVLEKGKFKSKQELNDLFNTFDLANKPLIFSCGSGITACILYLAFEQVGNNSKAIYDGSWTEWANVSEK